MDKSKRIEFLDIAKGIGIISVVWYHIGDSPGYFLNLFFMPLFFLISGMFCNFKVDYSTFFKKRYRQIIGPLIIGIILGCIVEIFVNQMSSKEECFSDEFYNFRLVGNVPLWFLVALFWDLSIIYTVNLKVHPEKRRFLIFSFLSILGYILSLYSVKNTFFIGQALLVLPFLLLGSYLKDFWIEKKWHKWYTLIVCIAFCSIIMCFADIRINIHQMSFRGYYVLPFLTSLAIVIGIFEISLLLSRTKFGKLLSWIGYSTIFILILHELFVPSIKKLIYPILDSYDFRWSIRASLILLIAFLLCVVTIFIGKLLKKLLPSFFP